MAGISSTNNISTTFLKAAAEKMPVARALLENNSISVTPEDARCITLKGFNQEFANVLKSLTTTGKVETPSGQVLDSSTLGDVLSLNIYLQNLVGAKTIMVKISDKILDSQNTVSTSHKF